MLRALSQTEPPESRNDLARQRLAVVGTTIEDLFRRGDDRQPRRLLHAGHRAQRAAAGAAQRPRPCRSGCGCRSTPRPGMIGHRHRRAGTAAGLPAAAGSGRGAPHPARRRRRHAAHPRRCCNSANRCGCRCTPTPTARCCSPSPWRRRGAGPAGRPPPLPPLPRPARPRRPRPARRPGRRAATMTPAPQPGPDVTPDRSTRAVRAELTDAAVVSRSWGMALATLVSRITGFIRIVLLAAILGRGAVQRVLRGQPTAEPDRGPGAGGHLHRDLRSGAGPRRTRRPRRRRGLRPPAGDAGHHGAAGRHRRSRWRPHPCWCG